MELVFRENGRASLVELIGDLDSSVSHRPEEETRLFSLLQPGCQITLDVSRLTRLSPVGLRLLLLFYRQATSLGSLTFQGAPQELADLAEATGFRDVGRRSTLLTPVLQPRRMRARIDIYPTHQQAGFGLQCGSFRSAGISRQYPTPRTVEIRTSPGASFLRSRWT